MFGQGIPHGFAGGASSAPVDVDFLVVAGGGSGSTYYYQFRAGAGGAGGRAVFDKELRIICADNKLG